MSGVLSERGVLSLPRATPPLPCPCNGPESRVAGEAETECMRADVARAHESGCARTDSKVPLPVVEVPEPP